MTSPELALVDPVLRRAACAELPPADDVFARLERLVLEQRTRARRERETVPLPASSLARTASVGHARASGRSAARLAWRALAAVAAAAAVVALVVGIGAELTGPTETVAPARPGDVGSSSELPKATAGSGTSAPTARAPRGATTNRPIGERSFAWAPTPGVAGYRVEFFRGAERVFSARTVRPTISLRASWMFRGRRQTLRPGAYRWYVWPIKGGRRDARAIVQATLTVPGA